MIIYTFKKIFYKGVKIKNTKILIMDILRANIILKFIIVFCINNYYGRNVKMERLNLVNQHFKTNIIDYFIFILK
ncbi:hypothetical protein BS637_05835 [Clostridium tepidum]|jgi:hypothetical protein|uniref:Uncharacterized protein n=1 Tax=Clostridium tepidum TaxID=1962263 RepID=A0ABX3L806_9CLOT|nr:hypothetical protein BS637_05835 [Clostridium tepidum]